MSPPPADPAGALRVDGLRRFRWLRHARRTVFVTGERVLVADHGRVVADCPRCAVAIREQRPGRLVVELAGRSFTLEIPVAEREREAEIVDALRHKAPIAAVSDVYLPGRSRRILGIHSPARADIVVTDLDLLFLARRDAQAEIAHSCPREAVHVLDYETRWAGGDRPFDRVRLRARDATVEFDVDGTRHERTAAVVAALGGVPQTLTSRKAHP